MRSGPRFAAPVVAAVLCVAGTGALTACGGSPERSGAAFCTELDQQLPSLEAAGVSTEADLDAVAATYDDLNAITPLEVQDDWQRITDLVHAAVTVVPSDAASVQRLTDATYEAERPTRIVAAWVSATCGFEMPTMVGLEAPSPPTVPTDETTETTAAP